MLHGSRGKSQSYFIQKKNYHEFLFFFFQPVRCVLKHEDGSSDEVSLQHTMNEAQIGWFRAGSALNRMAEMLK